MAIEMIVDLSNAQQKRNLLETLRTMQGMHRIEIKQHRPRRSDRQNRYYWPCFVQPFADFMRGQGEMITDDEAHTMFKAMFLRKDVVDHRTGEVLGQTMRSTTELTTVEFNAYLDACAQFLAEKIGFVVPEPGEYREKE